MEEEDILDERFEAEKCPIGGISFEKKGELLLLPTPLLVVEKLENELDWWKWLLLEDDPKIDDEGGDPCVVVVPR